MNEFIIIGRIYKDFELKETSTNKKMVELPVVVNNDGKDDVTYLKVLIFNTPAESTAKYCKKGDQLCIKGIIKNNNWEDDKGIKHYDYSFIAHKVTFLSQNKKEETKPEEPESNRDLYKEYADEHEINIDDGFLD